MVNLTMIKGALWGIVILGLLSGSLYILNSWHYEPIDELVVEVKECTTSLDEVANLLNSCETNLSKQTLEGYIAGLGESNETIIIDFDNIVY